MFCPAVGIAFATRRARSHHRNRRRVRLRHPGRRRPFENDSDGADAHHRRRRADLTRSGLFRQIEASGVVLRPARAEEVRTADWRARADAVVVGPMRALARRASRGPFRAGRRGQADAAARR
ncbi:MAG: hypothetical protein IPF60_15755 [Betaproteobacteria bacterium]|nr:hypothetical protein [Betaproteobacteria bacterium]